MAGHKSKATTTELRVVFDTNILHNQSASELVRQDVAQLITDNANHEDLTLSWFIPETVTLERRYQMLERSSELLPAIRKMERLLSHNLNITDDVIVERVDAHIAKQLASLGLTPLVLDTTAVDWTRVLRDAASRTAPFERGEKEKGFRDLLVGEAFIQLASTSPATPKVCRVILVSGDKLLRDMVALRVGDQENVKLFSNIEELRGFINTLASNVSEEFVNKYREAAKTLFFTPKNEATLFYSKKVRAEISQRFAGELAGPPAGATTVEQEGPWKIAPPEFAKKKAQRLHWSSRVTIPLSASRYETDPALNVVGSSSIAPTYVTAGSTLKGLSSLNVDPEAGWTTYFHQPVRVPGVNIGLGSLMGMRKIEVCKGQALVDVQWSVTVRTNGTLSAPSVDGLSFIETTWT